MSTLKILKMIKFVNDILKGERDADSARGLKQFNSIVQDLRPFVFEQRPPSETILIPPCDPMTLDALPFQTCSFEMLGDYPLYREGFTNSIIGYVAVVIVHEISPGVHEFWRLIQQQDGGFSVAFSDYAGTKTDPCFGAVLKLIQEQLQVGAVITEQVGLRFNTVKDNGKRIPHHINQIVRVVPKKESKNIKPAFGGKMDWSHRWEVMGHWRKINGIGKDREEKYIVQGFTWVVPHVKGPDKFPVVKKVRLIKEPEEACRFAQNT